MANYFACMCLMRIVLPLSLSLSVLFRQTGLSFIYLLLLLLLPMVRIPTHKTMAGSTGQYLRAVMVLSFLASITQLSFQIVLFSMPPYGNFLKESNTTETILRHVGLIRLNGIRVEDGFRYIAPEVLMLITSIAVYVSCTKLSAEVTHSRASSASAPSTAAILPPVSNAVAYHNRRKAFFITVGKCLALASLCLAGILRPSALNGVYFLAFLGGMTWWSCYKELHRPFGVVLHCIQVVAALHIMALFVVQLQWVQDFLTSDCNYCRYLGLTFLMKTNDVDPRMQDFVSTEWASFVNPVALLWLYYILGIESYYLLRPRVNSYEADDTNVNEHTHLIRNMSPMKYDSTGRRRSTVRQDAHGSVILSDGYEDVIQLDALGAAREEEIHPGICEQILDFFTSLFRIINRSSYIGTNIIMMAWSITYHSWLTFVLLLWASILWIFPNQRHSMMRCSPFLVVYAIFLLLAQYIYGMDLTNDELPDKVKGVNLRQIGFTRTTKLPCEPLFVKSLYTLFFWITLRQFMQERFERRNTSALEDMAAPLQITVGPATRGFSGTDGAKQSSQAMNWLGDFVNNLLTKFWIWVVAIMLFVIGLSGTRMTVYRIIYMALFLIFVLVFQLSYQIWRKFMYGFWLTVIIYSMSILVLIYTYQFDDFPYYWTNYLGISQELQKDIGMEIFQTSELFVKLLTPTFFLVITVIQMHYFHKDFLALTDISCRSEILKRESSMYGSSVAGGQGHVSEDPEGGTNEQQKEESVPMPSLRTLKQLSTKELQQLALQFKIQVQKVIDLLWLFLELHMLKLMLLSIMLLCVFDVCALHFIFLLLAVVALSFGSRIHTIVCHVVSVLVSVLLLVKMIYQINYFVHSNYAVNCTENDTTGNDADWLGLYKSHSDHTLPEILKGYIGLIFLATLMAVVRVRQLYKRQLSGELISRPHIMFQNIQRCHADRDLRSCFKYLLNYGFYKFGIEICLMATVALIGTRMDLYAVLYGVWLCVFVIMEREKLAKIWGIYQVFIVMLIPIQYAMAVGLPPALCIEYPWNQSLILRNLQEWMFLPDPVHPPAAYKLVCDFVLLMLVCRQSLVFRIERRYAGQIYAGGSNKSILKETEQPGFVNPVPDHISYVRSWLDIAKRCFLSSFLWVTLAIVFLAGTNRVNIFSLGYLVGAFVFLWQGEEIYLRPVPYILKRWNTLLGYNVAIIMIKALLQIIGCIFLQEVTSHACWAAQLFGITCIRKFPASGVSSLTVSDLTQCNVPKENSGLIWDGVCFGCLIMMRRLFSSYYFIHQINENKAMTVLASRGAELIEELRMKRIREQENQEHRILEKIRVKMERIKATQQKIQGPMFKEPESHHVAPPGSVRRYPRTNRDAVRSGDYYMFEELDDDVLEEKDETSSDDEGGKHDGERRITLSKFLDTAFKTDMERAAELALAKGTAEEDVADGGRRSSVKLTRNKSSFFTCETEITPQAQASSPSLRSDYMVPTSPEGSKGSYPSRHYPQDEADAASTTKDASSETEVRMSVGQRIWLMVKFAWAFVESAMVTLTKHLNHISRDYRYVMEVLTLEKKMLKEKPDFAQGVRVGSAMIWQPVPSATERSKLRLGGADDQAARTGDITDVYTETSSSQSARLDPVPLPARASTSLDQIDESTPDEVEPLGSQQPPVSLEQMDETQELSAKDQAPIVRLVLALWFAIISHSDLVCYFMVFLYQIKSATILSLPLPLMVFLWGTLTIPRPTKTFWVTMIAYTEVIVIVKWMFQFEFLPWNGTEVIEKNPFFPPRIIGIESKPNYATYDLFLLLIIFFHRYMLKSLGLWKTTYEDPVTFKEKEQKFRLETEGDPVGLHRVDEEDTLTADIATPTRKEVATLKHGGSRLSYSAPGLGISGSSSQLGRGSCLRRRSSAGSVSDQVVTQGGRRLSAYKTSLDQSEAGDHARSAEEEPSASNVIVVRTDEENAGDHIPGFLVVASKRYCDSVKGFFSHLLSRVQRVTADVYALMFLCDFFNFMVVIFGFASFGSDLGEGGVSAYLEENKVPIPFLVMLILQFALIVVDRALYLRKYILGKIVFQFLLVVGVHIWMFFILPLVTDKQFSAELPPQMWYMVKCFYLLLSAYQIRSGYPTRILGNVLCKRYNVLNMVLFKGFMAVPFLFELRALMDWMWTDTSMTVWDWLKMEDIFANIFQHKCARRMESEYPQPRGEKKKPLVKYFMGGGGLFVIIAVIWFPLVIFALGSTVGQPNLPYDVTVTMDIGNYQPIYEMSAQNNTVNTIDKMSEQSWNKMQNAYMKNKAALTFLSNYDYTDIAVIRMSNSSRMVWGISQPDRDYLIADLQSSKQIVIRFTWHVSRLNPNPKTTGEASSSHVYELEADVDGKSNPQRQNLIKMLNGTHVSTLIPNIFPKFLKVSNRGMATPITQLMAPLASPLDAAYRNLSLQYNGDNRSSSQSWWSLEETCNDENYENFLKKIDDDHCSKLVMYTFNDKSFPKTLSFISGEGIIGLYFGLVLLFSKIIRSIMTGLLEKIMFTDLPNVDRILQLCLDIYLVRESGELDLEEDLFAKLVFLYRSPETLIKWTRPREEGEGEEGNAQPVIAQ
ncbi:piezo-type mechanosensitive ion channel component isoform X4 [Cryptotermes secundus]|uniref:piezo-type mechanosensitive ion channel component isoform X4 n=1 Tax=Cryptotermes secundus TaxID=105785 RepID=UPI000CD7C474|nr:piezo-type mechanosensitive ion channel component isoform X4 [Cryptotermes secundus]